MSTTRSKVRTALLLGLLLYYLAKFALFLEAVCTRMMVNAQMTTVSQASESKCQGWFTQTSEYIYVVMPVCDGLCKAFYVGGHSVLRTFVQSAIIRAPIPGTWFLLPGTGNLLWTHFSYFIIPYYVLRIPCIYTILKTW